VFGWNCHRGNNIHTSTTNIKHTTNSTNIKHTSINSTISTYNIAPPKLSMAHGWKIKLFLTILVNRLLEKHFY
jgi:hypothetical protein